MIQALAYAIAIAALPLALVSILSAVWWNSLSRPWLFFATGNLALYGLIALVGVALTLFGSGFSAHFAEVPLQPGERQPAIGPVSATVAISVIVFLAIGTGILWALKQWLLKP